MICFHFTIFVVLETTHPFLTPVFLQLWFAFILLSLSYWKQRYALKYLPSASCDLLSFYYLCRTGNNTTTRWCLVISVVICFHFTIFVVLETTFIKFCRWFNALWFAFILLSLSYWKQPFFYTTLISYSCDLLSFYYLCRTGNNIFAMSLLLSNVVICFHFTIFVVLETTYSK